MDLARSLSFLGFFDSSLYLLLPLDSLVLLDLSSLNLLSLEDVLLTLERLEPLLSLPLSCKPGVFCLL